jgi:hypothetical protein
MADLVPLQKNKLVLVDKNYKVFAALCLMG